MTKTIATLWNGNIDPIRYLEENSVAIKRLENLKERNSEKLKKSLDETSVKIFEAYTDCIDEYTFLIAERPSVTAFA